MYDLSEIGNLKLTDCLTENFNKWSSSIINRTCKRDGDQRSDFSTLAPVDRKRNNEMFRYLRMGQNIKFCITYKGQGTIVTNATPRVLKGSAPPRIILSKQVYCVLKSVWFLTFWSLNFILLIFFLTKWKMSNTLLSYNVLLQL